MCRADGPSDPRQMRMRTSGTRPIRVRGNGTRGGYRGPISAALIRKDDFVLPRCPKGLFT
jgi:hypothetical protein